MQGVLRPLRVVILAAAGLLFILATSAGMPEVAATRFGGAGEPNAFMTRFGYQVFMAFLVTVVPLLVAFLPRLVGGRWPYLLNIPHRTYWLAPERREATLAAVEAHTAFLATILILLICYVHWLLMQANAANPPRLDIGLFFAGMGVFAVVLAAWIVRLFRRFSRPRPG